MHVPAVFSKLSTGADIACLGLGGTMAALSGVNHVSLSVTDLNRSERFYTDVFDLIRMMDFGFGRILLHPQTGFIFGIATHEGAEGEPFSELKTGLDHFGFDAASRAELVEWEQKLDMLGVVYTPIRDMEFGYHLNFRDPDNIALEIMAYNEVAASFLGDVNHGDIAPQEVESRLSEYLASLASDVGPG
jgi:glyoxylase I family protein